MKGQRTLVTIDPGELTLTERQQHALDTLTAAGHHGATSDDIGAAWCEHRGKHTREQRCGFDGANGRDVLRTIRKKGAPIKQLRDGTGRWTAINLPDPPGTGPGTEIPY